MSHSKLAKAVRGYRRALANFRPGKDGMLLLETEKVQIADALLESFGIPTQPPQPHFKEPRARA